MTDWTVLGRKQSSSIRGKIPTFYEELEKISKKFGQNNRCAGGVSNLTYSNGYSSYFYFSLLVHVELLVP
jgi:hypothetical protein